MSREFPDWINPWAAAQGRREFRGTLPLARLERLAALLTDTEGEAEFSLRASLDSERRPMIDLWVKAELPLVCQASLEPYVEPVERRVSLSVIGDEAESAMLPEDADPVLIGEGRVAIAQLVEDELLLGMPQVPRKPDLAAVDYTAGEDSGADAGADDGNGAPNKPFAGLGEMLGRRD